MRLIKNLNNTYIIKSNIKNYIIDEKEDGIYLNGFSFNSAVDTKDDFRNHFYKTGIQGLDKSFTFDFKLSNTNRVKLVCFIDQDGNQQYYPEGHWGLGKADEYGDWEIILDYPNINSNQWYHATIYRYNTKNIGLEIKGQLIQKTFSHNPFYNQFCLGAYGFSNEYVIIKNIQEVV